MTSLVTPPSLSSNQDAPSAHSASVGLNDSDADVYRSVSRAAIISLAVGLLGLFALVIVQLIVLPIIGLIFGWIALRTIKRYPAEFSGRPFAKIGVALSALALVTAPAYHAYIYATEVPEGYTRVSFTEFMSSKNVPDVPTSAALAWNGKPIFVKGYVHPSSMDSSVAKKFILVPDLGTCCFGGQPPLTHMIEVNLTGDQYAHRDWRKKALAGTFTVNSYLKPVDGLTGVYYQLQTDILK